MYEDDNFFWESVEEFMLDYPIACAILIFCGALLLLLLLLLFAVCPVLIPYFVGAIIISVAIWKFLKWGINHYNR